MRIEGHAVESICRVLREQGCQIAARTYRLWAQPNRALADRVLSDAVIENKARELAWTVGEHGRRRLAEAVAPASAVARATQMISAPPSTGNATPVM